MDSQALAQALVEHNPTEALFTPLSFDKTTQLFITRDPGLGFGFVCSPLTGMTSGIDKLETLLKIAWPAGTLLQVSLYASQDVYAPINALQAASDQGGEHLQYIQKQRCEYLLAGAFKAQDPYQEMPLRDFKVIITVKVPLLSPVPTPQALQQTADQRVQVARLLKDVGFFREALNPPTLIFLMQTLCHWQKDANWRNGGYPKRDEYNKTQTLAQQFIDIGHPITFDHRFTRLNQTIASTFSLTAFPKAMQITDMLYLVGDPLQRLASSQLQGHYLLTLKILMGENERLKTKIQSKRNMVTHQAFGPLLKWLPQLAAQKADLDTLSQMLNEGQRPVEVSMGLVHFSDSESAAIDGATQIKSQISSQQFKIVQEGAFNFPLFLECLPFGAKLVTKAHLSRYQPLASKQAARLFPVFADPKGSNSGVIFLTRKGQPYCFDLFDSVSNYNATICAQSGSGKSFVANSLIQYYLARGARIWVIDSGGSYRKLADVLNGQYFDLSLDAKMSLNPFTITKNIEEEIDTLLGIFEQMTMPRSGFDDEHANGMRNAIIKSYREHGRHSTIDTVIAAFDKDDNTTPKLQKLLKRYAQQGELGYLFQSDNEAHSFDWDHPFTVVDLDGFSGQKQLQLIVLMELIYVVGQVMAKYPKDVPKILFIDEGWKFFKDNPDSGVPRSLDNNFRTIRKCGGSCVLITQSDFDLSDKLGDSVKANTANKLYLAQNPATLEAAIAEKKIVYPNEHDYELLRSLQTEPGVFSECFIDAANGSRSVVRLYEPRTIQLLNTTQASELAAIDRYRQQGQTMTQAIASVIQDEQKTQTRR